MVAQAKEELKTKRIEAEAHDLFTPQTVKGIMGHARGRVYSSANDNLGARTYYLRNIFHAWGDSTCKQILINAKEGLSEDSVLLIDEIVLPERDATTQGAQHDVEVMVCVGT